MSLAVVERAADYAEMISKEEPRPILSSLPEVPPLIPEMLPSCLRDWLADEAERLNSPLDFMAIPALVSIGALIGNSVCIRPKKHDHGWLVTANLWGGIIGRPSVMKSPAKSQAMRPLKRLEADAAEAFKVANRYYQAELKSFEAKQKAIESQMRDLAEGKKPKAGQMHMTQEELIAQMANLTAPDPVYLKRIRTSDSTIEKLGELHHQNSRGLLVDRDELMGLLSSFDRDGHEGDRAFYLEGWNGYGSYTMDRIVRGTTHIENLCLSVFGTTQPDKIQKYLYRTIQQLENDGLIQRFQLLVYPDAKEPCLIDKKPNVEAYKQAQAIFEKLANASPIELGATLDPISDRYTIGFSFEGYEVFSQWYDELSETLSKEQEPIIQEHLGKYRSLMPKLALIFHLIDSAGGKIASEVSATNARLAAAWCGYLEAHARRIYSLGSHGESEAAQFISKKLRQAALEDGFTVRDIRLKGWRMLKDNQSIEAAMAILEAHGWVSAIDQDTSAGGRPTTRYFINPNVKGML